MRFDQTRFTPTSRIKVPSATAQQLQTWHKECIASSGHHFDILFADAKNEPGQLVIGVMPIHTQCNEEPDVYLHSLADYINNHGGKAYLTPSILEPGMVAVTVGLRAFTGSMQTKDNVEAVIAKFCPGYSLHFSSTLPPSPCANVSAGIDPESAPFPTTRESPTDQRRGFFLTECTASCAAPSGFRKQHISEPMMRITFSLIGVPPPHVTDSAQFVARQCMLGLGQNLALLEMGNDGQVIQLQVDAPRVFQFAELSTEDPLRKAIALAKAASRGEDDFEEEDRSVSIRGASFVTVTRVGFAISPGFSSCSCEPADVRLWHYIDQRYSQAQPGAHPGLIRALVFYVPQALPLDSLQCPPIDRALMFDLHRYSVTGGVAVVYVSDEGDDIALFQGTDVFHIPTRHWAIRSN